MHEMDKRLDDQMKALIDTAIDLQDMWMNQVSSKTSDVLADNYPDDFPLFLDLIEELKAWRNGTKYWLSEGAKND